MRVAIITGGGTGIGRATAVQLAKGEGGEKFSLVLVGRTMQTLNRTADVLRSEHQAEVLVVQADVSNPDEVESAVHRAAEHFGRVDVLVNNAGVAPSMPLHALSPRQWREILDTNLSSAFYLTRAVWPWMKQQFSPKNPGAQSVIVNISSIAARDPFPGLGAYGVAKAGVNMLTLSTAREGVEAGIRCVAVAPGAVDTDMFRKLVGPGPVPEDMALRPEDVAKMIVDVISGPLRYCSGDTLYIHRKPS